MTIFLTFVLSYYLVESTIACNSIIAISNVQLETERNKHMIEIKDYCAD